MDSRSARTQLPSGGMGLIKMNLRNRPLDMFDSGPVDIITKKGQKLEDGAILGPFSKTVGSIKIFLQN